MDLILVRHGESLGNVVDYDCHDPELTDIGVRQAHMLAKRLEKESFDYVLCSPLIRALDTAWIVCLGRDHKPEVHMNLREVRGLEKRVGLSKKALEERFPGIGLMDESLDCNEGWIDPGDESREMGYNRAKNMVDYIKNRFTGDERVLVVAHGTFNGLFISALLGLDYTNNIRFGQHNTCLNGFHFENNQCKVLYLNDKGHLQSS